MSYKEKINPDRIPRHIAIIMDGNGRWAKQRGKERGYGHQAGVESVHAVAEEASRQGVKFLTLYAFSTENWNRPSEEIETLMNLFVNSMEEELFMKNNIRFRVIGNMAGMPSKVQEIVRACMEKTSDNTEMTFVLALNYSSRWEITDTVQQIARKVQSGELSIGEIDTDLISSNLTTNFMPDPDLLIRTGGEIRLSNYLLWQSAYSELYFCDTFWPDFREEELLAAIYNYQQRERRFGKTSEQL